MVKKRYSSKVVVFLLIKRYENNREEILLQKRMNTSFMNNMYDMACSGHLEQDESISQAIVREAFEELGIIVSEKDVKLLTVVHPYQDDYLRFFFTTDKYEGTPTIKEPEKCSDLRWFPIDDLPNNTTDIVKKVLTNIKLGINYDDGNFSRQKAQLLDN